MGSDTPLGQLHQPYRVYHTYGIQTWIPEHELFWNPTEVFVVKSFMTYRPSVMTRVATIYSVDNIAKYQVLVSPRPNTDSIVIRSKQYDEEMGHSHSMALKDIDLIALTLLNTANELFHRSIDWPYRPDSAYNIIYVCRMCGQTLKYQKHEMKCSVTPTICDFQRIYRADGT